MTRAFALDGLRPIAKKPQREVFVSALALDALPFAAQQICADWLDMDDHARRDDAVAGWYVRMAHAREWKVLSSVLGVR